jgi:hypothetical protein
MFERKLLQEALEGDDILGEALRERSTFPIPRLDGVPRVR